jgi:hypothetical protein
MGSPTKKIRLDSGLQVTHNGNITNIITGDERRGIKLSSGIDLLKHKPQRNPNKILEGHVLLTPATPLLWRAQISNRVSTNRKNGDGRVLPRMLLDNGQGKSSLDMDISSSESDGDQCTSHRAGTAPTGPPPFTTNRDEHILLCPPVIKTMGRIATGATTPQLHKQNKIHWTNTLLNQPISLQWEVHNGATILPTDHWDNCRNVLDLREMAPQGLTLKHEAAGVLAEWAQFRCPTQTGRDWTLSEIQAAIERGPHQSALKPNAIVHFANKVTSKVNKGQGRVVL